MISNGICHVKGGDQPGRFNGRTCGKPTAVRIEYGCVHEHVKAADVCEEHAERVTRADADLACPACWGAGHKCPVTGRIAAPGGAR